MGKAAVATQREQEGKIPVRIRAFRSGVESKCGRTQCARLVKPDTQAKQVRCALVGFRLNPVSERSTTVVRRPYKPKVEGSNPSVPIMRMRQEESLFNRLSRRTAQKACGTPQVTDLRMV